MRFFLHLISFLSFSILLIGMGDPHFVPANPPSDQNAIAHKDKKEENKSLKNEHKRQAQEEKRLPTSSPNRDKEDL